MKKSRKIGEVGRLLCLIIASLSIANPVLGQVTPPPASDPAAEPSVLAVAKVLPAVVNINTERVVRRQVRDPFDDFAAQFFGEVLELGKAIFHAQHGRLVIDVHLGCKRKFRDRRRVHVDQTPLRVARQQMAAADLAPLPVTPLVLVVLADLVFSLGHLDRLGLPERECVDRAGGPAPTGGAMAVPSALRIAGDDNRDSAAEALPVEGLFILAHESPLSLECKANLGYSDRVATSDHPTD